MELQKEKQQFVKDLLNTKIKDRTHLEQLKRKFCATHRTKLLRNSDLIEIYRSLAKNNKIKENKDFEKLLKKRATRTLSGVATISVITKPYPCPGECIFCPTEARVPKSYLSNEPSVMKAIMTGFDPFKQTQVRLKTYYKNGHDSDKIEIIVQGGTWSHYPLDYKYEFIKGCFDACNTGLSKTPVISKDLAEAQKINQTAKNRIVGLTLETRPDYINEEEIKQMRDLGCTRVELGVQTTYEEILEKNKRKHSIQDTINATKLLKQAGIKICYHMMPNLYGSNLEKDYEMFKVLFSSPDFQPDLLKIYPCSVLKNTKLYDLWQKGEYVSYTKEEMFDLLIKIKQIIPRYVRINRLIRDIPSTSIKSGNFPTNMRQILQEELKKQDKICKCIRCREARDKETDLENANLFVKEYKASLGTEYFIYYASPDKNILYAFIRLRINNDINHFIPELKDAAIIREVHTYGRLAPIKSEGGDLVQHAGFGKRLIKYAEDLAQKNGYNKIAVISGIGVREYYEKQGYNLKGTYMVKKM